MVPSVRATGPNTTAGTFNLSATAHTNAGTYTDTWGFTDSTGNYNDASGQVIDIIEKAGADISVTGYVIAYDGAQHTANGTASGDGILDLSGTADTDAGT